MNNNRENNFFLKNQTKFFNKYLSHQVKFSRPFDMKIRFKEYLRS